MANVLCSLNPEQAEHFMPMRECLLSTQLVVYEAIGDLLLLHSEAFDDQLESSTWLVQLDDGRKVPYSFGVASNIEIV